MNRSFRGRPSTSCYWGSDRAWTIDGSRTWTIDRSRTISWTNKVRSKYWCRSKSFNNGGRSNSYGCWGNSFYKRSWSKDRSLFDENRSLSYNNNILLRSNMLGFGVYVISDFRKSGHNLLCIPCWAKNVVLINVFNISGLFSWVLMNVFSKLFRLNVNWGSRVCWCRSNSYLLNFLRLLLNRSSWSWLRLRYWSSRGWSRSSDGSCLSIDSCFEC